MAGLTKEERVRRAAEKEAELRAEIEAEINTKYEDKFNDLYAEFTALKNSIQKKSEVIEVNEPKVQSTTPKKVTKIPLDTMIPVICNFPGKLVYISEKIKGYTVEWDGLGSIEYMELGELASMRNTNRRFFEDNWIVFEDSDEYTAMQIYDFLKVNKFYKNVFTPKNIDEIFSYDKDKIVRTISTLSKGMKTTIAARAKEKLDNGTLDKNIIDTLEMVLDVQFEIK